MVQCMFCKKEIGDSQTSSVNRRCPHCGKRQLSPLSHPVDPPPPSSSSGSPIFYSPADEATPQFPTFSSPRGGFPLGSQTFSSPTAPVPSSPQAPYTAPFHTPTSPLGAGAFPLPPLPAGMSPEDFPLPSSPVGMSPEDFPLPSSPVVGMPPEVFPVSQTLQNRTPDVVAQNPSQTFLQKYPEVMKEKNTGTFHPTEPLHQLWWSFEYFHARFAKKVAAEVGGTAASLAAATALGAAGGLHGAAVSAGGSAAFKAVSITGSNIIKKIQRQWQMKRGKKKAVPASDVLSLSFADEMYIWPGYEALSPIEASLDIYYKPPKSGSINQNLLDYRFLLDYIRHKDPSPNSPNMSIDLFAQMQKTVFQKLDAFWEMSRIWPMLDYLYFNYGFYYYTEKFKIESRQIASEERRSASNCLYGLRFYFLSKNFYLEHFFRIILPTYEFILHPHRRGAVINTPDSLLVRVIEELKRKYDNPQTPQSKSILKKIKSVVSESSSVQFAKKTGMPLEIAPFLSLLKEYINQMVGINYSTQINHLNILLNNFINSSQTIASVPAEPSSPVSSGVFNTLSACFTDTEDVTSFINTKFRNLTQSPRSTFFADPEFVSELKRLKAFFYQKIKDLIAKEDVVGAFVDVGRFESIADLLGAWFEEYSNEIPHTEPFISDFGIGAINGLATALAVFAMSTLNEIKLLKGEHIATKIFHKSVKHLFKAFGTARIALGTVNYVQKICTNGETQVFDFLHSNVMSSGLMSAALIGPTVVSLIVSFAIQSAKMKIYDDMDKDCLRTVDRLVQMFDTTNHSLSTRPHSPAFGRSASDSSLPSNSSFDPGSVAPASPSSSAHSPISSARMAKKSRFAQQSASPVSAASSALQSASVDDRYQLLARIYMFRSIYENIWLAETSNRVPTHEYRVQGGVLIAISPVLKEVEKLKKYLDAAESVLMSTASARSLVQSQTDPENINGLARIYLEFFEATIKLINIKKYYEQIADRQPTSKNYRINEKYLNDLAAIMEECDNFYEDLNLINDMMQQRILTDNAAGRIESEISALNTEAKKFVVKIIRDLNAFSSRFDALHLDHINADQLPPNLITDHRSVSRPYYSAIRRIFGQTEEHNGEMMLKGIGAPTAAEAAARQERDARYHELRDKEIEYAKTLNLGLILTKPLDYLTESEKLTLYRDFGRVVRHLFQNTPTPSDLMERATELENLVQKISANNPVDIAVIKEFVKKQFSYTQAVLFKENFVYYARVYQFLCERLRIEFLSSSKPYIDLIDTTVSNTAGVYSEHIRDIFSQLKDDYSSFFSARIRMFPDHDSGHTLILLSDPRVPPGTPSSSQSTHYCLTCRHAV